MSNKLELTKTIREQLVQEVRPTVEEALREWWVNPNNPGLRLTPEGYFVFNLLKIESHTFESFPRVLYPGHLLALDRKLTCPYYISIKKEPQLILFGSKQAMMLALYGDFEKWLKSLSN